MNKCSKCKKNIKSGEFFIDRIDKGKHCPVHLKCFPDCELDYIKIVQDHD